MGYDSLPFQPGGTSFVPSLIHCSLNPGLQLPLLPNATWPTAHATDFSLRHHLLKVLSLTSLLRCFPFPLLSWHPGLFLCSIDCKYSSIHFISSCSRHCTYSSGKKGKNLRSPGAYCLLGHQGPPGSPSQPPLAPHWLSGGFLVSHLPTHWKGSPMEAGVSCVLLIA